VWGKGGDGKEREGRGGRGEGRTERREWLTAVAAEPGGRVRVGGRGPWPPLFKRIHLGPSLFACENHVVLYTAFGQVFVEIVCAK